MSIDNKKEIRIICKKKRGSLSMEDVRGKSTQICNHLLNHPMVQQSGQVLVYSAIHKEVDLRHLVERLWEEGKSVAFPRVKTQGYADCGANSGTAIQLNAETIGETIPAPVPEADRKNDMDFYEITCWDQLVSGAFGILEPQEGLVPITPQRDAVICVPGVAFSVDGSRIGMGRGYYDRYLSRYPYLSKIGVAYELQMGYNWEADPLDIPMDAIVTEVRL